LRWGRHVPGQTYVALPRSAGPRVVFPILSLGAIAPVCWSFL